MLAVALRLRERDFAAGAVLGLAALLKFYPILLVPLFALDRERVRGRLMLSAVVVTAFGLAVAIGIWGKAPLQPLHLGTDRGPRYFRYYPRWQGWLALVGGPAVLAFLIRANTAFVLAVEIIAIVLARRLRLHWLEASVLGYLAVCLTYKVGHQQFYIPWLFLVAVLPVLAGTSLARRLAWLCLPFVLFLSIFQWGYAYGSDGYHNVLWRRTPRCRVFRLPVRDRDDRRLSFGATLRPARRPAKRRARAKGAFILPESCRQNRQVSVYLRQTLSFM